jgi:alanyl-tRNA synthetase
MDSRDIRRAFTGFFEQRGHALEASAGLVLDHDPTLMFVNAGMVPFKDVFTGKETRAYSRATSSQKCIRISGKHNDLENVGVTARHHTFFEMLGNFSFGDYFKRQAIEYAWEFITKTLGLDPNRLVFTVFGGEEGYGPADEESVRLWKDVTGCGDDRIKRCDAKDNFWSMGNTGPCGPCTEIHYCLGVDPVDPSTFGEEPTPEGRGWFELWNLVFMQFDRQADGALKDLPAPSVDTGAGLERLAVVKQEVLSNYDTDLLRPIVELAGEIAGKTYGQTQAPDDTSMRVIADHARLTAFLLSEGVSPDKGGAPYVLRRVMRRAIRHGYRLGIEEPFLYRCAGKVVELMGADYPQLVERAALIEDVARAEGRVAFKLYDTFGFPFDLQEVIGEESGFVVDEAGFQEALEEARARSREGSKLNDSVATEKVYYDIRETLGGAVKFLGYDRDESDAKVAALLVEGETVDFVEAGAEFVLVTDRTPFYGEKGGQAGDRGTFSGEGFSGAISDALIPVPDLTVHVSTLTEGRLSVGDGLKLTVDDAARTATRRNHSATHLLHWALRKVLGETATQKGSLVSADRLRFDYSSTQPLAAAQIRRIEDLVNGAVLENSAITTDVLPMDEAKERGAIGIFEEKYGDVVRVLRIGPSLELCGGTHAFRTGDIGLFTILSDNGVAAGVRRIEASTGLNALAFLRQQTGALQDLSDMFKTTVDALPARLQKFDAHRRDLEREVERLQRELVSGGGGRDLTSDAKEVDGVRVLGVTVPSVDGNVLREMADKLRDQLAPAVVMLGTESGDGKKALLACSVSKEVTSKFRAGDLVKRAAKIVGGGGGGRPDFAQAGGSDPSKLADAVADVYEATGAAAPHAPPPSP